MSDLGPMPEWLERANRLATAVNLLSTTVHEVNNALQVITGSAEMLGVSAAPDVVARRAEAIGGQARRASALLAELSAFARDESTAVQRFDLGHMGQRSLALRQYTMAKLKLENTFEALGEPRFVSASPRAIMQVALNLLVNAEQALAGRPAGSIKVRVVGETGRVDLMVEDNGPGISPEVAPRLFEAAAQASETHLGIGLAVSKMLAERFGGSLRCDPVGTGGCRFTLSLPSA
jgi:C4-dicarboxylate-specific signal transduction histidine kinase